MNPEDPRLRAYALGQLEPGSPDHSAVEQAMDADPALRRRVADIQRLASAVHTAFVPRGNGRRLPVGARLHEAARKGAPEAEPSTGPLMTRLRERAPTLERSRSTNRNAFALAAAAFIIVMAIYFASRILERMETESLRPRDDLIQVEPGKMPPPTPLQNALQSIAEDEAALSAETDALIEQLKSEAETVLDPQAEIADPEATAPEPQGTP